MKRKKLILSLFMAITSAICQPLTAGIQKETKMLKPRLVVLTDIAPVEVEPDDMESMVKTTLSF